MRESRAKEQRPRFDGVLGLGLESLALDPEFSFYGQLTRPDQGVSA